MAVIRCKMCGAPLPLTPGVTVVECESCGIQQTVPSADNEKKLTLFARAERLRAACEFDKAAGIFEAIVAEFPEEAEAYWCLVLCKFGIEYVDDPATGRKIPTCHRSSFESVMDDADLEQALENADVVSRRVYREEAKRIDEIRKGIISVSAKEDPYDIFICYKETSENGDRTLDSVLAQDIYDALTDKGYRVFFARISLEDKLGQEYEPYIFAALNSAKIMLAVGTDYEYYNAVWVKNEWSRYLKLMAEDRTKHLIPCYKGLDAYDMPKEFAKLQAQDLGKVGAIQDLLRGVEKLLPRKKEVTKEVEIVKEKVVVQKTENSRVVAMLKRGNMALEDGEWEKAKGFFEDVLNWDAECAEAYLGLVMCEAEVNSLRTLIEVADMESKNYRRVMQFANECLRSQILEVEREIEREEQEHIAAIEKKRRAREELIKRELPNVLPYAQKMISAGGADIGVKTDGTICSSQAGFSMWNNLDTVSSGEFHTLGLLVDGTVIAWEDYSDLHGACDVFHWKDITAINAGMSHSLGLRSDGKVVAIGDNELGQCDVSQWQDIIAISAGAVHSMGLKADGTVVAAGANDCGACDVLSWQNIIAVSAGGGHSIGLKSDGTVVATAYLGEDYNGQCDVAEWRDILAISAGDNHSLGLKMDGTVVAAGDNQYGQCDVTQWKGIIAISAGLYKSLGLTADGTVVSTGENADYSQWKLFNDITTLGQELSEIKEKKWIGIGMTRETAKQRMDRQEELNMLYDKHEKLMEEEKNLHGLFAGKQLKKNKAEQMNVMDRICELKNFLEEFFNS